MTYWPLPLEFEGSSQFAQYCHSQRRDHPGFRWGNACYCKVFVIGLKRKGRRS